MPAHTCTRLCEGNRHCAVLIAPETFTLEYVPKDLLPDPATTVMEAPADFDLSAFPHFDSTYLPAWLEPRVWLVCCGPPTAKRESPPLQPLSAQ